MRDKRWIMSEGGPLIVIEATSAQHWGGVFAAKSSGHKFANDYAKACEIKRYLGIMPVQRSSALIVGDAPLDTCFWRDAVGTMLMVRIWGCEQDFDVDAVMSAIPPNLFDAPLETLEFTIRSPDLIMFDSAEPGNDPDMRVVHTRLDVGTYRVLTQAYNSEAVFSLVLHRFDQLA